jgi:hypothetical protein
LVLDQKFLLKAGRFTLVKPFLTVVPESRLSRNGIRGGVTDLLLGFVSF